MGPAVAAGDVVWFAFATPDPPVTACRAGLGLTPRVPAGTPALSPLTKTRGTYWLYRFDAPGPLRPLLAAPRAVRDGAGGRGRGGAGPGAEPVPTASAAHGEPRSPAGTAGVGLDAAALAPGSVLERGSVARSALAPERKAPETGGRRVAYRSAVTPDAVPGIGC